MKTRLLLNAALATLTTLIVSCGEDKSSSGCDECRQQNAPINEALTLEPSVQNSANLETAPTSNVKEAEVNKDPGFAPVAIGEAAQLRSSESIDKATQELLSKQSDKI